MYDFQRINTEKAQLIALKVLYPQEYKQILVFVR